MFKLEGAFADVFRVEYKPTKEIFAMKVMSKAKIFEFNIEHQMSNEIQIMSLLDHPNIIKLEYYFETKEELILVLEYAQKGTLFKLIKEREKFINGKKTNKPILNDKNIIKVIFKNLEWK